MKIFGLLSLVALVWSSPAIAGKKKKKKNEPAAPVVGWHQAEGDMGACYHPPNFEEMGVGSRRMAWMTTRDELMSQWQGNRGDGVLFDDVSVINLETALLAKPERIEQVAKDNLAYCKDAMSGKGTSEWSTWIVGLNGKLTEGECAWPNFAVTMYNYLSINNEWQNPAKICKGDAIKISISSIDYYRLAPKALDQRRRFVGRTLRQRPMQGTAVPGDGCVSFPRRVRRRDSRTRGAANPSSHQSMDD